MVKEKITENSKKKNYFPRKIVDKLKLDWSTLQP